MVDFKSFLDTTVLQEKKPVTYKSLARNLNINVNLAKQALYQYATSEPTVSTIYCITGTLEENATSIQLVESDKLEDTKQRFLQISSIHVYSIIPYQPKDLSVLVIANKDIMDTSREDRIRNGLIRNNGIEIRTVDQQITTAKPIVNTQPSTHTKQQYKTTTTTTTTSNASTKSNTKSSKSTPVKRKGTLSFENMGPKSKKPIIETLSSAKETPKSQPDTKKRIIRSIQESDDDDDEEDEESLDARLARSATIQVNDIFSDDEDMEDNSKSTKVDKKKEKEASPDMDIDIDNDHAKKDTKSSALSDEDDVHEVTPGKIRRKVQKKKTYKNERGFLVTETVWEWEEVDADIENKNKETTKSPSSSLSSSSSSLQQSKTTKKPTNAKKTEQKSLLSFWGKK